VTAKDKKKEKKEREKKEKKEREKKENSEKKEISEKKENSEKKEKKEKVVDENSVDICRFIISTFKDIPAFDQIFYDLDPLKPATFTPERLESVTRTFNNLRAQWQEDSRDLAALRELIKHLLESYAREGKAVGSGKKLDGLFAEWVKRQTALKQAKKQNTNVQ